MLESVLRYLNNWFVVDRYNGTYEIQDGTITLPFLQDGQWFRIVGSVLNDGLYKYGDSLYLLDETFNGSIWALAIPKDVVTLSSEISEWQAKNGNMGPYSSESFGGYSYTRATNSSGQTVNWQDVFSARLMPYRKLRDNSAVKPNPHMTPPVPRPYNPWR